MSECIKSVIRGDYMNGPFSALAICIDSKMTHSALKSNPTALKLLAVARVLFSTLLAFIVLVPLAIIATPLVGVAICAALAVLVASAILNHQQYQKDTSVLGNVVNVGIGTLQDAQAALKKQ